MPLSEHVYCVAIAFKVAEQVEQQDCIQFCVKLEHSSMECIWVIQRPQLWVTGDWQFHHDNAPARASRLVQSFLAKHQITHVTQPPYRFGILCLLAFPKTKIIFEREEILDN